MSALSEYISLIPKGIPNLSSIVEGVLNNKNFDSLPEEKKIEILNRRLLCAECPFMSENAKTSLEFKHLTGSNYVSQRQTPHCTFCGCPLKMRTAALSKGCGAQDWNAKNPQIPMPVKWFPFKEQDNEEAAQ